MKYLVRLACVAAAACAVGSLGATAADAAASAAHPAAGPDPREIPIPEIQTPLGKMPGVAALPAQAGLPDVLAMNDGTKVRTREQWQQRRAEIRRTLEYYATGAIPPPPGNVRGAEVKNETVLEGTVKYRLVHLTFGPESKLALDIGIFTPAGEGPFPAIILHGGTPPGATPLPHLPQGPNQGRGENVLLLVGPDPKQAPAGAASAGAPPVVPGMINDPAPAAKKGPSAGKGGFGGPVTAESFAQQRRDVFARGYAIVLFNPNDCAEDTTLRNLDGSWAFRNTRFFPAYPGYDWGILAAWAWGVSRIADYLETDSAIDKARLIVTGASRNGKSSMIAAAFDERLMGAPVVTGGGGVGAYRLAGPRGSETLDLMEKKYPNWFSPHLHEFWGQREKLPFDQHWFLALCAPRPFLALEGDADVISLPAAVRASIEGAKPAYALFGAEDKLGINYAHHGHAFTNDDWTALMDFADRHLRGKNVERRFDRFPTEAELDAARAPAKK
jgi:hypothetical protein